jgi:hypothetical protein
MQMAAPLAWFHHMHVGVPHQRPAQDLRFPDWERIDRISVGDAAAVGDPLRQRSIDASCAGAVRQDGRWSRSEIGRAGCARNPPFCNGGCVREPIVEHPSRHLGHWPSPELEERRRVDPDASVGHLMQIQSTAGRSTEHFSNHERRWPPCPLALAFHTLLAGSFGSQWPESSSMVTASLTIAGCQL